MTYQADSNDKHKVMSFTRLKQMIETKQLPYDFRGAKYLSDGEVMNVRCLMGHPLQLKPYELKSAYTQRPLREKDLPVCWRCIQDGITRKEYKYRVNVFYGSGREIEVVGRYVRADYPIKHRIIRNGQEIVISPKDVNALIKHNPPAYLKSRGFAFEKVITERIINANKRRGSRGD